MNTSEWWSVAEPCDAKRLLERALVLAEDTNELLDLVGLAPGAGVIDVGCGRVRDPAAAARAGRRARAGGWAGCGSPGFGGRQAFRQRARSEGRDGACRR
jgi:hypothetical protein